MSEQNKTLAEIMAELRELSVSAKYAIAKPSEYPQTVYGKPIALYFAELADRIEAATRRETGAAWNQGYDHAKRDFRPLADEVERIKKSAPIGNSAAMREALEMAKVAIEAAKKKMGVDNPMILEIIDAALAKPPRNCNVGTAGEQAKRLNEWCNGRHCVNCQFKGGWPDECKLQWAQMPYEGDKTKGESDESK